MTPRSSRAAYPGTHQTGHREFYPWRGIADLFDRASSPVGYQRKSARPCHTSTACVFRRRSAHTPCGLTPDLPKARPTLKICSPGVAPSSVVKSLGFVSTALAYFANGEMLDIPRTRSDLERARAIEGVNLEITVSRNRSAGCNDESRRRRFRKRRSQTDRSARISSGSTPITVRIASTVGRPRRSIAPGHATARHRGRRARPRQSSQPAAVEAGKPYAPSLSVTGFAEGK